MTMRHIYKPIEKIAETSGIEFLVYFSSFKTEYLGCS